MKLDDIYRQIPSSTCPPDCGECCGPVYPARVETRNVKNWCREHGIEFKDFGNVDKLLTCPYLLEDKRCQIYPVRPFMCRIYGITQHKLLLCQKCEPVRILTVRRLDYLYKRVYKGEKKRAATHVEDLITAIERGKP